MQDNALIAHSQPFAKLAQSNIDLLTRFTTSPEVASLATANATQLFQHAAESGMKLLHSGAFAQVTQGMLQNYTEFLTDVGRNWMVMMLQGHEALTARAQEATEAAVEAAVTPGRRGRQSA